MEQWAAGLFRESETANAQALGEANFAKRVSELTFDELQEGLRDDDDEQVGPQTIGPRGIDTPV